MRLSNWPEWQAADDKQLDAHFDAGTVGEAVPRPREDPMKPSQVFRLVWNRLVKPTGVRKSRACLDGSKRAAPWLRQMVQTYSSCVELPCLRAFIAICANKGYYICFGDVDNACQQSPPPSVACFLNIDDTIADWHERRFGEVLDRSSQVIPLFEALQGHPEAGVLWERPITDVLINKMKFKNTTHEKKLCIGTIDGEEVLACRQVDDFAAGAASKAAAEKFMDVLREHVQSEHDGMGIPSPEGLCQRCNGPDIFQTRDCIKIGCESHIDRMMQTHGWDKPSESQQDSSKMVPVSPTVVNKLMTLEGPPEKSPEAHDLALRFGFSCRNALGELICACVICRLDIGCAACLMARFSSAPHEQHFIAIKGVCRCLRATKSWGITCQRERPLNDLPVGPFVFLDHDPSLPLFPFIHRDELATLLDAAHAADLRDRRSIAGLLMLFCCAAIAWKSRIQSVVATSSTEAEFCASVTAAKLTKCLRCVFQELGVLRPGPSRMFVDNQAALAMINESRPTPRARHIDTQHFAIQEWRLNGDIIMLFLAGLLNAAHALTEALGWILHCRHVRRGMGHCRIGSPDDSNNSAPT